MNFKKSWKQGPGRLYPSQGKGPWNTSVSTCNILFEAKQHWQATNINDEASSLPWMWRLFGWKGFDADSYVFRCIPAGCWRWGGCGVCLCITEGGTEILWGLMCWGEEVRATNLGNQKQTSILNAVTLREALKIFSILLRSL